MAKIPKPGQPVRGSKSGTPVMALFDLLGRSWAMGVLWNLSKSNPLTFRALEERCETVTPATLNKRLKELREAGLVEKVKGGYAPTVLGTQLYTKLVPVAEFSLDWAKHFSNKLDDT